jgi:hypothetical protein
MARGEALFVLLSFIFLFFREDFLHGHELSHDILCRRTAMTTAEQTEASRFRGAKSSKLKA